MLSRIQSLASDKSYAKVASGLGMHPETLRRYMIAGPPGMHFLLALFEQGYSLDWIAGGTHSPRRSDHPVALSEVSTDELTKELCARLHTALAELEVLKTGHEELQARSQAVRGIRAAMSVLHEIKPATTPSTTQQSA